MREALALDHFIHDLSEPEFCIRGRDVGPESLSVAEAIAVRMEEHRIAVRQRNRLVGKAQTRLVAESLTESIVHT